MLRKKKSSIRNMQLTSILTALLLLLCSQLDASAQKRKRGCTIEYIRGTVSDDKIHFVADADVTLKHLKTGKVFQAKTDYQGEFIFENIPQGWYRLEIVTQSFKRLLSYEYSDCRVLRQYLHSLNLSKGNDTETKIINPAPVSSNVKPSRLPNEDPILMMKPIPIEVPANKIWSGRTDTVYGRSKMPSKVDELFRKIILTNEPELDLEKYSLSRAQNESAAFTEIGSNQTLHEVILHPNEKYAKELQPERRIIITENEQVKLYIRQPFYGRINLVKDLNDDGILEVLTEYSLVDKDGVHNTAIEIINLRDGKANLIQRFDRARQDQCEANVKRRSEISQNIYWLPSQSSSSLKFKVEEYRRPCSKRKYFEYRLASVRIIEALDK